MIDFGLDGFVIASGVIGDGIISEVTHEFAQTAKSDQRDMVVEENPHVRSAKWGRLLRELASQSTVTLGIKDRLFIESARLISKRACGAAKVPPHQDGINDSLALSPAEAFSVWVPLADSSAANGGLIVYAGSHLTGYKKFSRAKDRSGGNPLMISGSLGEQCFSEISCRSGDVVLMDVRLIHESRENRSETDRLAVNIRITKDLRESYRNGQLCDLLEVSQEIH